MKKKVSKRKKKKTKSEVAMFECVYCGLQFPAADVRRCPLCDKDLCTECARPEGHRCEALEWEKERTPGYFYTLFFTVVFSALFLLALIVYVAVGPVLQDIIGKVALLFLGIALVLGAHHIWYYRVKKHP